MNRAFPGSCFGLVPGILFSGRTLAEGKECVEAAKAAPVSASVRARRAASEAQKMSSGGRITYKSAKSWHKGAGRAQRARGVPADTRDSGSPGGRQNDHAPRCDDDPLVAGGVDQRGTHRPGVQTPSPGVTGRKRSHQILVRKVEDRDHVMILRPGPLSG